MHLTRRGWAIAGCGGALAAGAVAFAAPSLLVAAAALGATLVAVAGAFVRRLGVERDALSVAIDPEREHPTVDSEADVSLTVERRTATLPLRIVAPLPGVAVGATDIALDLGTDAAGSATVSIRWSVAGTYRIGRPTVVATDPLGLFVAGFQPDAEATVRIRSRTPSTGHLGTSGDRIAAAYGEHRAGRGRAGIEPAELRRYQQGDDIGRIDWKATARLDDVYVMEPEAETDRRTILLLDHRATMGVGDGDATPLSYLRYAALAIVESARELGDPLGAYAVGDDGVTIAEPPGTSLTQYRTIADAIRKLQATNAATPGTGSGSEVRSDGGSATAAAAADRLAGGDDAFARRLHPFFDDVSPYIHRVEDDPLFAAARTYLGRLQGTLWTVIVTDDSRRAELRETVELARSGGDPVLVMLAPRVLFEPGGLVDLDRAHGRYAEFESFRRDLATMERVEAIELAPGDRIEAVIEAGGGHG